MSIERQADLLNAISQIMYKSAQGAYDEMSCNFEYETYKGGWSVGSAYTFVRDGASFSELLDDPKDIASGLVHDFHELMKTHTGGDWKNIVLTIDADGKAHTKFTY